MSQMPVVSIIMPVYNSEEFVESAARTVLEQSYRNTELIMVDDGSGDASGAICDRLAEQDGRVTVVHKPNGGICSARNVGLARATGTYVCFCDNDDEYLPGLLEDNVRVAEQGHKDVVRFLREHLIVLDGRVIRREVLGEGQGPLDVTERTFADDYYKIVALGGGIWTGMYRREVLERAGIRFPEQMRYGYEDLYFNLLVMRATGNIALNPQVCYRWTERYAHSTSRRFSTNRLDAIRMCLRLEDEVGRAYGIVRRNEAAWAAHLVDTHVIRMLQQLTLPMCDLAMHERARQLEALAREEALSSALHAIRAGNRDIAPKTRLVATLLGMGRYRLLIRLFALNVRREGRVY